MELHSAPPLRTPLSGESFLGPEGHNTTHDTDLMGTVAATAAGQPGSDGTFPDNQDLNKEAALKAFGKEGNACLISQNQENPI